MTINRSNPDLWKKDIDESVNFYNNWFINFAPEVYRENRKHVVDKVQSVFDYTQNLTDLSTDKLRNNPGMLPVLRMCTCPPLARDRLVGLAGVPKNLVQSMDREEKSTIPSRMSEIDLENNLNKISKIIQDLIDVDLFPWIETGIDPEQPKLNQSILVVADRLCGAVSDPIVRNSQEQRQLNSIKKWLEDRDYVYVESSSVDNECLTPGTFTFRHNIVVFIGETGKEEKKVNIPVDVAIMKKDAKQGDIPIFIEAKSAGDFTNVNKRRKEEATKMSQLKSRFGDDVQFILFLCGYFDTGYLGYESAEGIDWVWEHRISDLEKIGI